jgi:hypothetical protein
MIRTANASYLEIARQGFWSKDPPDSRWHHYCADNGKYYRDGWECLPYDIETIFAASEAICVGHPG